MKKIFLDENIRDVKLVRKLKKLGHDLVFKPQGVSDYDLEDWLVTRDDVVMVTKDIQFDLKFVENKSFLVDTSEPVNDCVVLIDAFMSQFKK
jgi:hypothetical protein|uniref:ORF10 n=1 Tax=Nitrosopumilaceae spindle-shaped virus TaxID=3065433 RepID=A0AAT9JAR9_9VIRU